MCALLCFGMSWASAQSNLQPAIVLGSVPLGPLEVTAVFEQATGTVYKSTVHDKGYFVPGETVDIRLAENSNDLDEILKGQLPKRVFVASKSGGDNGTTNHERTLVEAIHEGHESPKSPFPYCEEDKSPIGGGEGYHTIYTANDADIVISAFNNVTTFKSTIENAAQGSVIYIENGLFIDLSGMFATTGEASIKVPKKVTIAGGRGSGNGMPAVIFTSDMGNHDQGGPLVAPVFLTAGDKVRITGLLFQGPFNFEGSNQHNLLINKKMAIQVAGGYSGLEVDNCIFSGWPWAAVGVGGDYNYPSFEDNHIHNNVFFSNKQRGLGYGVVMNVGYASITQNLFANNRHDIAGTGKRGEGYEAGCNTVLTGGTGHNFDMHGESGDSQANAGRFIWIHHNDFEDVGANHYQGGKHNIYVRGRPEVQCRIENNRFKHDGPQAGIRQDNSADGFGNMLIWNNIYDNDDYLGWYVQHDWLKTRPNNWFRFPSSNDHFMSAPYATAWSPQLNAWLEQGLPNWNGTYRWNFRFGDYDGDQKTDVYKLENGKLYRIPLDCNTHGLNADWEYLLTTNHTIDELRFGFFDGDHKTDIVRQGNGTIDVSLGANSNWSTLMSTGYPLTDLAAHDFDGNGQLDWFQSTGSTWRVTYNSAGQWQHLATSGVALQNLKFGWFNSNNITDVFRANGSNFLIAYEGNSAWTPTASSGFVTTQLDVTDFDGDGITDIFLPISRKISQSASGPWLNARTGNFPISDFPYGDF